MNLSELKDELGIQKVPRWHLKGEPTVNLVASFALPKTQAINLLSKMETDDIRLSDLMRRLVRYYLADHDGYEIKK